MIERIVKLAIDPNSEQGTAFRAIFAESKITSPDSPAATVYNCVEREGHFFTFSHWESEADLNAYRGVRYLERYGPRQKRYFTINPRHGRAIRPKQLRLHN